MKRHRKPLGFAEVVKSAFQFLESDYGMAPSHPSESAVRYTFQRVEVLVHLSQTSELTVHVFLMDSDGSVVNRAILISDHMWSRWGFIFAYESGTTNRSPVERFVVEAASNLNLIGHDLLAGNPTAFDQINESNRSRAAAEWLKREGAVLMDGINFTWKEKNYRTLIRLWDELQILRVVGIENSYGLKAAYARRKLDESNQSAIS